MCVDVRVGMPWKVPALDKFMEWMSVSKDTEVVQRLEGHVEVSSCGRHLGRTALSAGTRLPMGMNDRHLRQKLPARRGKRELGITKVALFTHGDSAL